MTSSVGPWDRRDTALLLLPWLPALVLVRGGLWGDGWLGTAHGETWGRLFVTAQVGRWGTVCPPGWADLLSAPRGQAFWPVDPVLQMVAVPLLAIDEAIGWAWLLALLSWSAGVGGYVLARASGGGRLAGLVAMVVLQLDPLWLQHGAEGVTEVMALGPPALAAAAALTAWRRGTRGAWALYAGSVALVAGTSPYYALFGALGLALSLPLWPDRRRAATLLGVAVAVAALFALPLVLTELGPGGRLSPSWVGGYRLAPDQLVLVSDGGLVEVPRKPTGFGDAARSPLAFLVQWHGGLAATVALTAGLAVPRVRRASAFGVAWLALGPGFASVLTWLGQPQWTSPLAWVLGPLTLGNPQRLAVVPVVLSAVAVGGVARRSHTGLGLIAALALITALVASPPLELPVTPNDRLVALHGVIEGPTATWPDGDPPLWNPGRYPKEDLWLAGHHGGAQAYDYGRGGRIADAPLLVRLSEVAGLPVGRAAAETLRAEDDAALWRDLQAAGFRRVLVVNRGLTHAQRAAAHAWLTAQVGPPLAEVDAGAVWAVPSPRESHAP